MRKKLTQEKLLKKVLYFAYGSNMDMDQLIRRVGWVRKVGTYRLENYSLVFDYCNILGAFANVLPLKGVYTEGVIYEMTYKQLLDLDFYEGVYRPSVFYKRHNILYNGDRKLHFYMSTNRQGSKVGIKREYFNRMLVGASVNNLKLTMMILDTMLKSGRVEKELEKKENGGRFSKHTHTV